ncbi:hypothetical protein HC256_002169 [Beauveria bassiana]|nr:hypothetical protein HC256_002169 [Beauveria bassiana]
MLWLCNRSGAGPMGRGKKKLAKLFSPCKKDVDEPFLPNYLVLLVNLLKFRSQATLRTLAILAYVDHAGVARWVAQVKQVKLLLQLVWRHWLGPKNRARTELKVTPD